MKAARITSPKRLEILDLEIPQPSDGECLVKLESWSVCGSDIRHGYAPIFPEEEYPLKVGTTCHECAGTVVESRSDSFKEGQRVIVLPPREGNGGLVEYIASDPGRMVAVPDEGDLAEWVMCQPTGTVLHACQQIGAIIGKRVLIIGQGGIGLSFTAMCARSGAKQIISADLLDYRLGYAKQFGATHTVNPNRDDLDEAVAEMTGGRMPDITIEAAGYPDTLNAALRLVARYGKVVVFGIQDGTRDPGTFTPIDTHYLLHRTATIIPTWAAGSSDPISHIETMIKLKSRGWWNPGEMVTHRMGFEDVSKAFEMYENGEDGIIKVVMCTP